MSLCTLTHSFVHTRLTRVRVSLLCVDCSLLPLEHVYRELLLRDTSVGLNSRVDLHCWGSTFHLEMEKDQ